MYIVGLVSDIDSINIGNLLALGFDKIVEKPINFKIVNDLVNEALNFIQNPEARDRLSTLEDD